MAVDAFCGGALGLALPQHVRASLRTPVASAVHAAASSGQGSEDSCGWAISSHGDDEPHIDRDLVYTLKRPMHEPI